MEYLAGSNGYSLLGTIIHEATHNLGPAHEYKVNGKIDDDIFGGNLATLAEEFKAQTGALWFLQMLLQKGIIDETATNKSYADNVFWAFGHIARGMTDSEGNIQPYSQLSAIQLGMLMEDGAITFDKDAMAANGKDKGAFSLHIDKFPASVDRMMSEIAKIKATGNKDALVALQKKHVEGKEIPFDVISERMLRIPKTTFVYSVVFDK